jgi:hypothetical protein
MGRISRASWGVCGVGLLVMLVAEVLRTTGLALYLWGALWVAGWIGVSLGLGMAVRTIGGWVAAGISVVATLLGLYFAGSGANGSFMAMSSISVIAVATAVSMVIQVAAGQAHGFRSPPPASSVTLGLAGVGVILLAGAFALLANGMALGFLAFGFSLGLVGTAVGFGAVSVLRGSPAAGTEPAEN